MLDENQILNLTLPLSDFLKSLGYFQNPLSRTPEPSYYKIEYVNKTISRTISFLLNDKQNKCGLYVRFDDDRFSISDFCTQKKLTNPFDLIIQNLRSKTPFTELEFRDAVTGVVEFLKQHLMDIITGQRWETIPMDWGPYR